MIKLFAESTPYSSVVGGGVMLTDNIGRAKFQIMLIGTTNGITKEQNDHMAARLKELINKHGLDVPS